jgi:hypothetical protein|nr:MAG TPA: hypothetical protein [Caudoviricetes sp.]
MHFPNLVLPQFCKTPIHVIVTSEEISKDGEPIKVFEADLKCNYQDKVVTVLTEQQKIVKLTGSALFCGDIAPNLATLSGGSVNVFGVERKIVETRKSRNPDGSVNYTYIGLE